jgi:hypothetical protein
MSSFDQANRGEKLGLVWRNRKKSSQIINDYLYLPFFLLIILWEEGNWPQSYENSIKDDRLATLSPPQAGAE